MAIGALALASVAGPNALARNDDGLKDREKQVQKQVDQAAQDLETTSVVAQRANARLQAAQADLNAANATLTAAKVKVGMAQVKEAQLKVALANAQQAVVVAQRELSEGQADVATQRQTLRDSVTQLYQESDPTLTRLQAFIGAQSTEDLTRSLEFYDSVSSEENATLSDYQATEVLLAARKAKLEQAKRQVNTQRAAAAQNVRDKRAAQTEAATAAATVAQRVAARAGAAAAAARAKRSDQAELAKLKAKEKQIHQQILDAAQDATDNDEGHTGDTDGILLTPVDAPVTSPYGYRTHPIYGYYSLHNGTDFGAGCGSSLRAVADGTVLSTYYSSVWGNRLYLNLGNYNGKNVTVIYNHLSAFKASEGDRVQAGDTVGYVGTTGWSTGCHLHFTLMVNGETEDPMDWL